MSSQSPWGLESYLGSIRIFYKKRVKYFVTTYFILGVKRRDKEREVKYLSNELLLNNGVQVALVIWGPPVLLFGLYISGTQPKARCSVALPNGSLQIFSEKQNKLVI